jgi:hypothetical protein
MFAAKSALSAITDLFSMLTLLLYDFIAKLNDLSAFYLAVFSWFLVSPKREYRSYTSIRMLGIWLSQKVTLPNRSKIYSSAS